MKDTMNSDAAHEIYFAVTSLGKDRWYWVVWPSLEMVQSGQSGAHVAEGYERAKAEAEAVQRRNIGLAEADAIRAKGVDDIICMSVNDAFVMGAWAEDRGAGDKVRLVADGNGDLTKALGLEMDGTGIGFGLRAQRFAAIVVDPLSYRLLGRNYAFGEENNAWVQWVVEPVLCYY